MKAQLSLELELYMALAGMALLFALAEFARYAQGIEIGISAYRISGFVDALNENLLSGNYSFSAYVPQGVCNATVNGSELHTAYGAFSLASEVSLRGGVLCPGGETMELSISYNATAGLVEVS